MRPSTQWIQRLYRIFTLFLLLGFLFAWSGPGAQAAAIVVDTTADDDTANGNCTLREAMIAARDNSPKDTCLAGGATDTISFNINAASDPGCNAGTGVCTIQPTTDLPDLYGSGNITIDGYSQSGASPATGGTPAEIRIVIDGSSDGDASPYGFYIQSPSNIIQGLAINQFQTGIVLGGSVATNNTIQGCYIGTDETGTVDLGNSSIGIWISTAGSGNQIGGTLPEHRNIISGNNWQGIDLSSSTTGTTILGNYIGTQADGISALPNENGIQVRLSSYGNTIGGSTSGARNVISGNTYDGITVNGGSGNPHSNTIEGNFIGVDATGGTALANGGNGVQILNGAFANIVGPDNIISGNTQNAVLIWTNATNENRVLGNFIGTDSTGTTAIPNASTTAAVFVNASGGGPLGTVIGGDTPAERNLISGNVGQGVRISGAGTDLTVVSGNFIGLDVNGTSTLLNGFDGVAIVNGAAFSTIGGTTSDEGNVIVADYAPVKLEVSAHHNTVSANLLGTDITGMLAMGGGTGVVMSSGAHDNTIGGTTFAERNVISGNGGYGVRINGSGTDRNHVLRNYIGVDITGTGALPNGTSSGMRIENSAQSNIIGPGNIIAYHATEGIYAYGTDTDFNIFTQNKIFANTNWNIALGTGANEDIPAPVVVSASLNPPSVSGTSCNDCTIEVYSSLSSFPRAGRSYLGTGVADVSGNWTVMTPGLHGPYLTATATHASMGTSQFSGAIFTTIQSLYLPLIMR